MSEVNRGSLEPVIFSGPSGVGKTFLVKHLAERCKAERLISVTTRGKRPGEQDMVDSHFLSESDFTQQEAEGELFLGSGHLSARYAFGRSMLRGIIDRGNVPLAEVYTPAIASCLGVMTTARTVFFRPPSIEYLEERMVQRGQPPEDIAYRLGKAEEEMAYFEREGRVFYQHVYTLDLDSFGSVAARVIEVTGLQFRADGNA